MQTQLRRRQAGRTAWLALGWIALIAFLDTFALVPVLAPYAKQTLNASDAQAGLILSLYSLANLLANFYSGTLIDRYGRRLPMALSLWAAGLLIALYPLAHTAETLMALRALHGMTGAVFVPALFALVGEYGQSNRAGAMGGVGALIGLAALLAPPLGGLLARDYGEPALFWGVAGLMTLGGFAALTLHEPTRHSRAREPFSPLQAWRMPTLRAAFLLTLAMTFAMGVLTFALPLRLTEAGYDAAYRGRLFGLLALIAIVLMAALRQAIRNAPLIRAATGVGLLLLGATGLSLLPAPQGMWAVAALYGIGFGLTFPAVHLAAFEHAPAQGRGVSLALLHACYSLGYVLGPFTAGLTGASNAGYAGALVGGLLFMIASNGFTRSRYTSATDEGDL